MKHKTFYLSLCTSQAELRITVKSNCLLETSYESDIATNIGCGYEQQIFS
jgi:hypothetical protein